MVCFNKKKNYYLKTGFWVVISLISKLEHVLAFGLDTEYFNNTELFMEGDITSQDRLLLINPDSSGSTDLIAMIGTFINIILGLVGVVLFVLILVAGGMWMTAAGNEDRVKNAQKIIKQAVMGVVVIVLAFALSNFVLTLLSNSGAL